MPAELVEPAGCVDEALLLYRGSSSGWENATEYFYSASSAHPANAQEVVDPGISLRTVQPLPPTFTAQFQNVQYKSFMGLFPQINRAWLSVDSNLFLWAYADMGLSAHSALRSSTQPADLYVYEGISQIIVSVALVPPRPGVFVDSVKHLLAVATPVDVTLLGVTFSATGEISLVPTNISVATDGVLMLKLQSTPDGRIFMAGADGSLHEFAYDIRAQTGILDLLSGRPAKRARKLVHTPTPLSHYLIPSSLKSIFSKNDELVDLAIDAARAALYTLSQAGSLAVYDISDSSVTRLVTSVNVSNESRNMVSLSVPAGDREYVSIHAVTGVAYSTVHLIVVTSYGERIYFSTLSGAPSRLSGGSTSFAGSSRHTAKPKGLSCIGYRPSPDRRISSSSRPCIHIAWCERGAAILADLKENDSDRLISVYPDANLSSGAGGRRDIRPGASRSAEIVFETSLSAADEEGASGFRSTSATPLGTSAMSNGTVMNGTAPQGPKRTFAVAEVSTGQTLDQSAADNDLIDTPSSFWVLTSTAMHLYERVQPVDRLREILTSGGGSPPDLEAFFSRYGAAESCAMCLEIAVSQPSLLSAAANAFYTYGGDPKFDRRQAPADSYVRGRAEQDGRRRSMFGQFSGARGRLGRAPIPSFDIGRPTLQSAPLSRFSGAHDGASLYLAKALHPLWNKYITTNRDPDGYQSLQPSKELLAKVRDQLLSIVSFLDAYSPDAMLPDIPSDDQSQSTQDRGSRRPQSYRRVEEQRNGFESRSESRQDFGDGASRGRGQGQRVSEARRAESSSILALKNLCIRTVQALALLLILADHQLHRLAVSMPEDSRSVLARLRLCDLVVSDDGAAVSSSIIEAIFASYADGAGAVNRVGRILQERCPSYFGDSDVDLHRGLALLRKAVDVIANSIEDRQASGAMAQDYHDDQNGWMEQDSAEEAAWTAAQGFAEEAARVLKAVPDRVYDIVAVCQDFKAVRALPSLIDVALTVGRVAEASGKQDRAETAYSAILESLRPFFRPHDGMEDGSSDALRDAGMRVALGAESELFLKRLYEFLVESKQGEEILLQRSSPNLEKFLEEKQNLDLLWRYYAHHGRYLEAAGVLLKLSEAEGDALLVDRLNYLSCAMHNAKTAASKGDNRAGSFLSEISDYMDVAKVQMRVREELMHRHGRSEEVENAVRELDGPILDLSTLFNRYARPFKLYEACLEAFRCGAYRDDAYVRGLWAEIVEREATVAKTPVLLGQKMQALGREFYPSDVAFPTGYIIDLLERLVFRNGSVGIWRDAVDWVSSVMKAIGVPLLELIEGYRRMVENPQQGTNSSGEWSWTEENAQIHLLQATERVIALWTKECSGDVEQRRMGGFEHRRRTLVSESDKVLRAITLCKSRLRGMSPALCTDLVQRFEALERRISPLVQ